jgi:hypothetical protein
LQFSGNINEVPFGKKPNLSPVFTSEHCQILLQKILCRTVTIQVDTYWPFTYIKLTVTGQTNQVKLDGTYKTGDGTLDMNLDIAKLS